MKKIKSSKGFTLIEVLAVIVILGIIVAVAAGVTTTFIHKSRRESVKTEQKAIKMAAQSYLNANSNLMPKNIGDSVKINASLLRKENYLTQDIYNEDGEDCMKHSYVKVFKIDMKEYSFTPVLVCGAAPESGDTEGPAPEISITFENIDETTENLNDVKSAGYIVNLKGDAGGTTGILSYSYKIILVEGTNSKELYNSGTIKGNRVPTLTFKGSLVEFLDVTEATHIVVDVTCTNDAGNLSNAKKANYSEGRTFEDNDPPKCVYTDGKAVDEPEENSWINKKSPIRERTVGVYCDDGFGSGCKRAKFSKTWPIDTNGDGTLSVDEKSVEYAYIEIFDNIKDVKTGNSESGNRGIDERTHPSSYPGGNQDCRVRVNLDLVAPTAKLTAKTGTTNALNVANITVNDSHEKEIILANNWKNVAGSTDKWLNAKYYPNGVSFSVEASDELHLDRWEWKTNPSYVTNSSFDDDSLLSTSNPDGASGTFPVVNMSQNDHGTQSATFTFSLKAEGKRHGILEVFDRAGNSVQIEIFANIDRTAPPVPKFKALDIYKNKNYYFESGASRNDGGVKWSNDDIGIKVEEDGDESDKESGPTVHDKVELSGHRTYKYKIDSADYVEGDAFIIEKQGKTVVTWIACDFADNCSVAAPSENAWFDNVHPVCTVTSTSNGTTYNHDWINKDVTVAASCSDVTSGCITSSSENIALNYSNTYTNDQESIYIAGARGLNNPGVVKDEALNYTTCDMVTVKIDKTIPSCTVFGGGSWTNQPVTITANCWDNPDPINHVASGCSTPSISHTYSGEMELRGRGGAAGIDKPGSFTDRAGNSVDCTTLRDVLIDTTPPTCANSSGGSSSWQKGPVTITALCTEHNSTDVNDGHTFTSGCGPQASFTYSSECYIVDAGPGGPGGAEYAVDNAGNKSIAPCPANQTVKIDRTPPICLGLYGGTGTACSDYQKSATIYARCIDQGAYQSGCSDKSLSITTEGCHSYTISQVCDNVGWCASCTGSQNACIDRTSPTAYCGGLYGSSLSDGCGGSSSRYYWDGTLTYDSPPCGKTYYVYEWWHDGAGNAATNNPAQCGPYDSGDCPTLSPSATPTPYRTPSSASTPSGESSNSPSTNPKPPKPECSATNTAGCDYITPCRNGNTYLYDCDTGKSVGTVYHMDAGGTKPDTQMQYLGDTPDGKVQVHVGDGWNQWYNEDNGPSGNYCLYGNCTRGSGDPSCAASQCPDTGLPK